MIIIEINSIDRSSIIEWKSVRVKQNLTSKVDTASFKIRKYGSRTYTPTAGDDVVITDGGVTVFGGKITKSVESVESNADGVVYNISCIDHSYEFNNLLVSETYASTDIGTIVADIVANFTPSGSGFTSVNASSTFPVELMVFNQVTTQSAMRRLANIVRYEWYIDPAKDIHFFPKFTSSAPFNLTDDSGNYIFKSFKRIIDGTQLMNSCKVRGGEYDGEQIDDTITVVGDVTKIFDLPYRFSNLVVELNGTPQTIGLDNTDDPSLFDVMYNVEEKNLTWPAVLSDADEIFYQGNPKTPVLAIAEDPVSISSFGKREKLLRDSSIEDLDIARKRAQTEVDTYKDEISDATFSTYTAGLFAGQVINVNSTLRGINENFLIKSVSFQTIDEKSFKYTVGLVTTRRWGLLEFLRKINEDDIVRVNEANEVAELIITDIQTINITETCSLISALEFDETVTITPVCTIDALGPDTEPIWVWGYYVPSPFPADPKRHGLWDRDATWS